MLPCFQVSQLPVVTTTLQIKTVEDTLYWRCLHGTLSRGRSANCTKLFSSKSNLKASGCPALAEHTSTFAAPRPPITQCVKLAGTMTLPRSARSSAHCDASSGRVNFTHLFSAPLTKKTREPVPELNYQTERKTLIRTLNDSRKAIEFISEPANKASFARAVGCPSAEGDCRSGEIGESYARAEGKSRDPRGAREVHRDNRVRARSCRDGSSRILHFTGHGEEGKLTFENKYGELDYVEKESLSAMLQCRELGDSVGQWAASGGGYVGNRHVGRTYSGSSSNTAALPENDNSCYGYAPFDEESSSLDEVEVDEASLSEDMSPGGCNGSRAKEVPNISRLGLQLVFISSCHSESLAPVFIQAGVPHVIAVKAEETILDHKAHDFAHLFYSALLRGDTVNEAFGLASDRLKVSSDRPVEGHKFVLLPSQEDGGDHDVPVFDEVPVGQFRDMTGFDPVYRGDPVTDKFYGRAVEVQKVVRHMVDRTRLITIIGQNGIGKTQVLLKACAYTRERHVFGNIFFCRNHKAGRGNMDACQWLEEGFDIKVEAHGPKNIYAVVAEIAKKVKKQMEYAWENGSSGRSGRTLVVLDGCEPSLLIGQERVALKTLLSCLFKALPMLTVAVTMRAKGPEMTDSVGLQGEEVVVIKRLDDRSTAELFWQCCPRKLEPIEMDPRREAPLTSTGEPDSNKTMDAFSRNDIIRALKGHPSCVEDLCAEVSEERSLILRREDFLKRIIPEAQRKYEYPGPIVPGPTTTITPPDRFSKKDYYNHIWRDSHQGYWGASGDGGRRVHHRAAKWRVVCQESKKVFEAQVCKEFRDRKLSQQDLDVLAEDEGLWQHYNPPARSAGEFGGDVNEVLISPEAGRHFWNWFWQAIVTLKNTGAWSLGARQGVRCFSGFMKKSDAVSTLTGLPRGTFLIRFSASRPGSLAVHYVSTREQGTVRDVLINVKDNGSLSCDSRNNNDYRYSTLEHFVLSMSHLTLFHPGTPKEVVLRGDGRTSAYPVAAQRRSSWSDEGLGVRAARQGGDRMDRRSSGYSHFTGGYSPYMIEESRRRTIPNSRERMRPPISSLGRAWANA